MNELKIEYIPTSELIPYAKNAKLHPEEQVEQIKASIREFGMNDPIAIWKNNEIIEGHGRLLACQDLGLQKVPIIRLDKLTDEERRAYMLAHNQTTMNSGWDAELLDDELKALLEEDIDMSKFGFEIDPDDDAEVKEDDFDEAPPENPTSKEGQIWKLGRHRLIVGDSTDPDVIKRLMGGDSADLLITDPPYNVALGYHMTPEEAKRIKRRTDGLIIENDEFHSDADFVKFLKKAFKTATDVLKPGWVFYIWYGSNQVHNLTTACIESKLTIREHLVWVKSIFAFGRQDYHWRHEPCAYGWKDGAAHYFVKDRTQDTVTDDTPDFDKIKKEDAVRLLKEIYNTETSVVYEKKPGLNKEHPTMKPVGLFAKLIRNSSRPGEKVLDIFGGSGTTIIACEQIGRTCYMAELDPKFADVIIHRWEEFTGKPAELLNE